jgi:hypothetical protein
MAKKIKRFGMEVNCETGEITKIELPEIEVEDEAAPE